MVPDELRELLEWSYRLETGTLFYREDFDRAVEGMSDALIADLGQAYVSACKRGAAKALQYWLQDQQGREPDPDERPIRNLVYIFNRLAQRGEDPFQRMVFIPAGHLPSPRPDWSRMPKAMMALVPAAERYSRFEYPFSEEGREAIQHSISPEERQDLTRVGQEVQRIGYPMLKAWIGRFKTGESMEAGLIFRLLGVLDAVGVRYW